jgi:hypothetical protein
LLNSDGDWEQYGTAQQLNHNTDKTSDSVTVSDRKCPQSDRSISFCVVNVHPELSARDKERNRNREKPKHLGIPIMAE